MRFHRAWMVALQTIALLLSAAPIAYSQSMSPYGAVQPAMYNAAGQGYGATNAQFIADPSAAYGGVVQTGHPALSGPGYNHGYGYDYLPQYGGGEMTGQPAQFADGYCNECGGYGHHEGGPYMTGTCGPRWFDASIEGLYWKRADVSRTVDFTSDGVGAGDPLIVLSTDDLDFDYESGAKVTLRYDIGPASVIEASYFGFQDWQSGASVTDLTDNLFSVFSDYGTDPLGGFSDTDEAQFHSIYYESELQSLEVNWRRDWMSSTWRSYGSFLVGARYVQLGELFRHVTQTEDGAMNYRVRTENDLVGVQVGGDIYFCIFPGLAVGSELKAGAYNNSADQITNIEAVSLTDPVFESDENDDIALVAEASVIAVYQISPALTLRGGYQAFYMDGVALAPENFNSQPPFLAGPRDVFINDNGNAFYHGPTAGVEWIW